MSGLVKQAEEFATKEHQRINHVRKYSNLPYQTHLQAVSKLVATVTEDEKMIAAAWLHDTVEDTPATLGGIGNAFGEQIAELVEELTDISKPSDGNRAARKEIDRQHLATASHRAKKLLDKSREKSAIDPLAQRHIEPVNNRIINLPGFSDTNFKNKYFQLFTARDIAESLLSFDSDTQIKKVDKVFNYHRQSVASIRINGRVQGFVKQENLKGKICGESMRHFTQDQVLRGTSSSSDVIHVLTRHEYCFVNIFGDVSGVVSREDINKPQVRMWLFGLIAMIKTALTQLIEKVYPEEIWKSVMSKGRLEKTENIWHERKRRNLHCKLIKCLQFSDKAGILISDKKILTQMGFEAGKQAKKVIKELESLRNHLAHSQDIESHDWVPIARFVNRLSENII